MYVAGLVTFNARTITKKRTRSYSHRHHIKDRETSSNIYVGLKIYSMVRSRTLIQYLFDLGICISYDRVLSITKSLYEQPQSSYDEHGIFIPRNLRKGCFVILVKDNIDKNATANLVSSHFHGTGISLLQHVEYENQGEFINISEYLDSSHHSKKLAPWPAGYTTSDKVCFLNSDYYAPLCSYNFEEDKVDLPNLQREKLKEKNDYISLFQLMLQNHGLNITLRKVREYSSSKSERGPSQRRGTGAKVLE